MPCLGQPSHHRIWPSCLNYAKPLTPGCLCRSSKFVDHACSLTPFSIAHLVSVEPSTCITDALTRCSCSPRRLPWTTTSTVSLLPQQYPRWSTPSSCSLAP
eukprot:4451605-Amphidinium_carterae.1